MPDQTSRFKPASRSMKSGRTLRRGQWFSAMHTHYYEAPSEAPDVVEVWCYTDKMSYLPGETVRFHTSSTGEEYTLEVVRDGCRPKTVHTVTLPGKRHPTPDDAYEHGCGWPVAHEWKVPDTLPSGGYVVTARIGNATGETREQQHWFAVLPGERNRGDADRRLLLICATSTWIAYNEWGGTNNYWLAPPEEGGMSVALSVQRPWSRGFVWLPEGAPRTPAPPGQPHGAVPRYRMIEWSFANGFSKYYGAAGWAMYERLFVDWAEPAGYAVDVATQHDLHFRPEILDDYPCIVMVGHDEYYSWEMRDTLEAYIERGGNVARFAGNFVWQIRLEEDGTQVCYKELARTEDPVVGTDRAHLLTSAWEDHLVKRWPAETLGLNGLRSGIYAHWAAFNPRSPAGYTVYRPEHWVFEGTDLYFGDLFGAEAGIFGYEVDGVAFTFQDGRPVPTFEDGAPESLEILAMAPASLVEEDHGNPGTQLFDGLGTAELVAEYILGDATPENIEKLRYGAGMMATFTRGLGTVFNCGSCEWVLGLKKRDFATERVTRNILDRFLGASSSEGGS